MCRRNAARSGGRCSRIEPKRLIFVDETGVTTAMTPAYAWAPRGVRAVDSAPATWATMTVIAALGLDGVCAPLAFPGSTDTAAFQSYVDQALVPALHAGDVVVLDNLKPHLTAGVAASIERGGTGAAAAAVQSGLHADRGDVVEGQAVAPPGRGEGEGCALRCLGRGAEASDPRGHPRLVPARRPVRNSWVNRCSVYFRSNRANTLYPAGPPQAPAGPPRRRRRPGRAIPAVGNAGDATTSSWVPAVAP